MKTLQRSFYQFLWWLAPIASKPAQKYVDLWSWLYFHVALAGLARLESEGR